MIVETVTNESHGVVSSVIVRPDWTTLTHIISDTDQSEAVFCVCVP